MSLINEKMNEALHNGQVFFSFEYFPPRTEAGLVNLYQRIDRMAKLGPLFVDVTWSAGGVNSSSAFADNISLQIVKEAQDYCCVTTCMHLTCNLATKEEMRTVLDKCKELGIRNVMALRGDPPRLAPPTWHNEERDFPYAKDLVKFIRKEYGDYFCIAVAGYPYGHPDQKHGNISDNYKHLKEKVDAGANFIVSQLFFEADDFLEWYHKCREYGIHCPIIPGILPLQSWRSLQSITALSAVELPVSFIKRLEPIKDNDEAIKEYGVKFAIKMCQKLIRGGVPGLHFYTLNQEAVTAKVIAGLSLSSSPMPLPWRRSDNRQTESIRPIFWANRSKSYISRTEGWGEYPNGRWGDSSSPAFGDLEDHHLFFHASPDPAALVKEWGAEPLTASDIGKVFVDFIKGKVKTLPWIEDAGLSRETDIIANDLVQLNELGFWTINSQPSVNGVPSSDPILGWGNSGGVVYQKAYLEFFTTPKLFDKLRKNMKEKFGKRFDYQSAAFQGSIQTTLIKPTAVTWGVFPGMEVAQPTIVDPESFRVWREEAFQIWLAKWGSIYQPDSPSFKLIQTMHNTLLLVNIVDNDYINGNIFDAFNFDTVKSVSPPTLRASSKPAPTETLTVLPTTTTKVVTNEIKQEAPVAPVTNGGSKSVVEEIPVVENAGKKEKRGIYEGVTPLMWISGACAFLAVLAQLTRDTAYL